MARSLRHLGLLLALLMVSSVLGSAPFVLKKFDTFNKALEISIRHNENRVGQISSLCDKGVVGRRLLSMIHASTAPAHMRGIPVTSSIISTAESMISQEFGKKPYCYLVWYHTTTSTTNSNSNYYYIYQRPDNKFIAYIIKKTGTTTSSKNFFEKDNFIEAITSFGMNIIYRKKEDPVWTLQDMSKTTSTNMKTIIKNLGQDYPRGLLVFHSTLTEETKERDTVLVFRFYGVYTAFRIFDNSDAKYTFKTKYVGPSGSKLAFVVQQIGATIPADFKESTESSMDTIARTSVNPADTTDYERVISSYIGEQIFGKLIYRDTIISGTTKTYNVIYRRWRLTEYPVRRNYYMAHRVQVVSGGSPSLTNSEPKTSAWDAASGLFSIYSGWSEPSSSGDENYGWPPRYSGYVARDCQIMPKEGDKEAPPGTLYWKTSAPTPNDYGSWLNVCLQLYRNVGTYYIQIKYENTWILREATNGDIASLLATAKGTLLSGVAPPSSTYNENASLNNPLVRQLPLNTGSLSSSDEILLISTLAWNANVAVPNFVIKGSLAFGTSNGVYRLVFYRGLFDYTLKYARFRVNGYNDFKQAYDWYSTSLSQNQEIYIADNIRTFLVTNEIYNSISNNGQNNWNTGYSSRLWIPFYRIPQIYSFWYNARNAIGSGHINFRNVNLSLDYVYCNALRFNGSESTFMFLIIFRDSYNYHAYCIQRNYGSYSFCGSGSGYSAASDLSTSIYNLKISEGPDLGVLSPTCNRYQ